MLFAPVPDQRRSERRWLAISVNVRMGKSLIEGTSLNLSEHGMYLFTAANIPLGSTIELIFRPPEEENPVQMSAIVRRKAVYLYGIEFLEKGTPLDEGCSLQPVEGTMHDALDRQSQ